MGYNPFSCFDAENIPDLTVDRTPPFFERFLGALAQVFRALAFPAPALDAAVSPTVLGSFQ